MAERKGADEKSQINIHPTISHIHDLMKLRSIFLAVTIFHEVAAYAVEQTDTLMTDRRNTQNVLLNASSDSQPRVISLGIPQWGASILDDGLPAAMYNDFFPGFWSWRSGLDTESLQLTMLDESALELGNIGFYAMSTSKMGSSTCEGAMKYSVGIHGRHQIDMNLSAPIGHGWGFNANVYQDLNRGTNHLDLNYLQEHIQYYKAALSKEFSRGRFFATWLYSNRFSISDPYGPFVFVGDGSIKEYEDFRLGRDQYLPATPTLEYVDVVTGEQESMRYVEDGGISFNIITSGLQWNLSNHVNLDVNSRLRLTACNLTESKLNAIECADADGSYTYIDGTPYVGNVQTRYLLYHKDKVNEWFTTARLKGHRESASWLVGVNAWFNWTDNHIMTTNYAHEAKKDPAHLLYGGQMYYVPNTGAQYVNGFQGRTAFFGQQQFRFFDKLNLRLGLRLEYSAIRGEGSYNLDGKTNNSRFPGWNIQSQGVTVTPLQVDDFNGAVSAVAHYRINDKWGLELNAMATQQHAELWQYGEAELPSRKPKRNYLVRGGVNFKNEFLDLQSLLMAYYQDNNYYTALWTHELNKPAGGYPAGYKESVYIGSLYSMRVLAWTTDFVLTPFKGLSLHGLFTFRNPQYSHYEFKPTFSDGYSEKFDFSGNQITESSAVEIELEPSYAIGKWKIWASARYYSRQYVNITNSLYFKSRWETFAGLQFNLNDKVGFGIDVVNFLNQTGASAGIQAASLATDASVFRNYLTSGTYIRPFTLEFSTSLRF